MSETRVSITCKIAVESSRSEVWRALTDVAELKRWFVREAKLNLKSGEDYHFSWGLKDRDGRYPVNMHGKCLMVDSEKILRLTWNSPEFPVTFRIESVKNGTVLTVEAEGFLPGSPGHVLELRGWTFYLTNLKTVLERNWDLREDNPERTLVENWVNYFSLR